MTTSIILLQLAIVVALIFKGARVGGIGLGIYGMVGVFILVFGFGLKPGNLPIDVMLIIVSVITAAATLQAAGGLDYLQGAHRIYSYTISVHVCHRSLHHVYHAVLAGSNRTHYVSPWHRTRHPTSGAYRYVPCCKRLLLPAQLSYDRGCYQLRPNRLDRHRPICCKPLVPVGRIHHNVRIHWRGLSYHPISVITKDENKLY